MSGFKGRHIVHIEDLSIEEMQHIMGVASKMVPVARGERKSTAAQGKVLASLFFEPSTRTRLSFEASMERLGGAAIGFSDPDVSSVAKGETLADTIRVISSYADIIVLRHPREGASRLATKFSSVPVINGGDGAGQHPTQTLLDLFTIQQETGKIAGSHVGIVGDLKYGRTVHSLANALARFGAEITFVSPPQLQMPPEQLARLKETGASIKTTQDLNSVIPGLDVIYVTRIQKERYPDAAEYAKVAGSYQITADLLSQAKKHAVVLHPLPRVGEIKEDVDSTPHARYFQQSFNGVPVRMAILALLLGVAE
jgi:aspartate carbamoyltransferase catalytic subunit